MTDEKRKSLATQAAVVVALVSASYALVNSLIADPRVATSNVSNRIDSVAARVDANTVHLAASKEALQREIESIKSVARSTDIKVARVEEALASIRDAQREDRVLLMQIIREMPRQ